MAINRDRPTPTQDNATDTAGGGRGGRYQERYTFPITSKEWAAADEGSYFVAITPTAQTGVALHAAATTFDEAKAAVTLYNGGQNRIYPQFLQLHVTAVGTAEVRVQLTVAVDTGNRRSSAGTAMVVNNVNMDSIVSSGAQAYIGAVVTSAASGTRRLLGNYNFRGTIDVVEDVYELNFGVAGASTSVGSRVATVADIARTATPCVVGPGQTLLIHQWSASQTAAITVEAILGFIER